MPANKRQSGLKMIDTHSHIYDEAYAEDFDLVVARAKEAGVEKLIMPDIDSATRGAMMSVAKKLGGYALPCLGLHPTSVGAEWEKELQEVIDLSAEGHFAAIGEIGLDEYWSKEFLEQQMEVFRQQLILAARLDLPVIIHSREATEDIFKTFDSLETLPRGVFHAFSGSYETYRRIKSYGDFKIGIGGVVTYKNAHIAAYLDKVAEEDILLETDAPWLTPVPMRGKRNESSYVKYIAEHIARLRHTTFMEVDKFTTANAAALFNTI